MLSFIFFFSNNHQDLILKLFFKNIYKIPLFSELENVSCRKIFVKHGKSQGEFRRSLV